jgi:hypothetical protein
MLAAATRRRAPVAVLACCLVAAPAALAAGKQPATATLEGCQNSAVQLERSATFVGEMTALPGTARMQMRIEVLERAPGELSFHAVAYPGLGTWLRAAAGVKTYKNLDRVTDLAAPAEYRAAIHFRWLNAERRAIRTSVLHTPVCRQSRQQLPVESAEGRPPAAS